MSDKTVCGKCQGTGWLLEDAGGSQVAKRCTCFGERCRQSLLDQANIPRRYQSCTLDNFEVHNDSHRDALKISRQFVKNYPAQDVGLVFIGPCVGKKHDADQHSDLLNLSLTFHELRRWFMVKGIWPADMPDDPTWKKPGDGA